jgi:uncharacterized membrane protein
VSRHVKSVTAACQICGREGDVRTLVPAAFAHDALAEFIRQRNPGWSPDGYVCRDDMRRIRAEYTQHVLKQERGELSALDAEVIDSLREHEVLAQNSNVEFEQRLTVGERAADGLAGLAGSWVFILSFVAVLAAWVVLNSVTLLWRPFDPYPYILLNLALSCLAAVQAPVIMMSQNRQEARDRMRGENDYRTNLKAELEVRLLNTKLDQLMTQQWHRLLEIQQIQIEMMDDLAEARFNQRDRRA